MSHANRIVRGIVSGGQTGVDRAALDAALDVGIDCGGWCPHGRRAEDGVIPARYPVHETAAADYQTRTRRNVRDSDGTLILNRGPLQGGPALTARVTGRYAKPCLIVELDGTADPRTATLWIEEHHIRVLNVAGPRESKRPGIHALALRYLRRLLAGT